jgi:hypothetical protein
MLAEQRGDAYANADVRVSLEGKIPIWIIIWLKLYDQMVLHETCLELCSEFQWINTPVPGICRDCI